MPLLIESYLPSTVGDSVIPNTILITLPEDSVKIRGLLENDVSISLQNNFGSLIPDISGLADIAQVFNATSMPAWIGASAQAWKGTEPIRFSVSFYLINYAPGLNYEKALKSLATMCTMSETDDNSKWRVKIHGGYAPNLLNDNTQFFDNLEGQDKANALETAGNKVKNNTSGTIKVQIGHVLSLSNLLITKLNITPSVVEVASSSGSNIKPLYYRVEADFQTCRAALSTDISKMFG